MRFPPIQPVPTTRPLVSRWVSTTTGSGNTADGFGALSVNSTGNYNTASGYAALNRNTTGALNTASGDDALVFNTTGSNNTAFGADALYNNNTGSFNTAIGVGALGAFVASGSGNTNIAAGYQAGLNVTTTSNNIEIGNQGAATDSGTIRIGTIGTQTSAFIAGVQNSNINGAVVVVSPTTGQLGIQFVIQALQRRHPRYERREYRTDEAATSDLPL